MNAGDSQRVIPDVGSTFPGVIPPPPPPPPEPKAEELPWECPRDRVHLVKADFKVASGSTAAECPKCGRQWAIPHEAETLTPEYRV